MAYDFPAAPALGDVFEQYKWDGVAWKINTTTVRPTLTAIMPNIAGVNDADLVVRVLGADFTLNSQVFLDSAVQTTTYVSAAELTFPYAINGTEYATVTVVTGGLVSIPGQLFQVIYHPIVTNLAPATTAAGGAAFTLTVNGGQFMGPGSNGETEIYIDGVAVATTYIGQTQVTCQVTPPAAAATQQVTVRNGPVTTSPVTNLPLTFTEGARAVAMHFGDTAPAAAPGDMWWTGGKLALAIDDQTSIQWVQLSTMSDTPVPGPWDFPDAPAVGEQFTPSGSSVSLTWDGQIWTFPAAGGGGGIAVSDAPPTGVPPNTLWWDSDSGNLFVNYSDADSVQWVQINAAAPDTSGLYLPLTGGTLTGNLTVENTTAAPRHVIVHTDMAYEVDVARDMVRSTTSGGWNICSLKGLLEGLVGAGNEAKGGFECRVGNDRLAFKTVFSTTAPGFWINGNCDAASFTVRGAPIVLGTEMTSMEERLIARICLLEERLARMEAR